MNKYVKIYLSVYLQFRLFADGRTSVQKKKRSWKEKINRGLKSESKSQRQMLKIAGADFQLHCLQ